MIKIDLNAYAQQASPGILFEDQILLRGLRTAEDPPKTVLDFNGPKVRRVPVDDPPALDFNHAPKQADAYAATKLLDCPARCRQTGLCHGVAYFEHKAGRGVECDENNCRWEDKQNNKPRKEI